MVTESRPPAPEPDWDYRTASICTTCRKPEQPVLEIQSCAIFGSLLVALPVGIVIALVREAPFFSGETLGVVFGVCLLAGLVAYGVATFMAWRLYGPRPKPPEGWCDCGDGGGGDGGD